MEQPAPAGKPRNGTIDFFRFVFCCTVVLFHAQGVVRPVQLFLGGYIAVEYFFIVSGFLMAAHAARRECEASLPVGEDTARFLLGKLRAVGPYYVTAFLVSLALSEGLRGGSVGGFLSRLFRSVPALLMLESAGANSAFLLSAGWYISAMLLSMLALYPLLRANRDFFCCVLAPLIVLGFIGWASRACGSIYMTDPRAHFICWGLWRGAAGISLGCVCHAACERIRRRRFSPAAACALTAFELGGYAAVILCAQLFQRAQLDFVLMVLLGCCVTVSFSGQSRSGRLFDGNISRWLGRYSLALYLGHGMAGAWSESVLPAGSPALRLALHLLIACAASLLLMLFVEGARRFTRARRADAAEIGKGA